MDGLTFWVKGPKKKGKTSGKSGKSSGGIIDGLSTAEMSRDQLEQFALRIRTELEREREERNFFQVERDKLRTFWEITRQQLEESRASLRNQDRALEEAAEKHEQEIKQFKQKVKHLMFEHQSHLSDLQVDGLVGLKLAEDEFEKREIELLQEENKNLTGVETDYACLHMIGCEIPMRTIEYTIRTIDHQTVPIGDLVDGLVGLKLAEDEFEKREIELLQEFRNRRKKEDRVGEN
ncbi:dynein regulatory complex subunit 4-like [Diaphorina citri]|uniref:Dynein regulatory complex subunit 4-like n=1 Tax=Diaphorina citri TaxID=121845 RepID=A0A3Q0IIX9_DIACI|nr:dynein regulatory complex subunit 4-like [Diaphorina citri]